MRTRLVVVALALAAGAPLARAGEEPVQVAVLRLLQRGEDAPHAWLAAGLSHLLSGELSRRPGVVVVEREAVDHLLRELDLGGSGVLASADASRATRVADADWGVLGTYAVEGTDIDVEISVVDAKSGATLRSARERGTVATLAVLVARLADRVLGAAGGLVEPARVPAVRVEAFAAYCEGILAEQEGDYPRAFVGYARALREEPRYAQAALELGRLYARMGEPEHAVVEWRRLVRESQDPDVVIEAVRLAVRTLEADLGRPADAAALLDEVLGRYPLHRDAWAFRDRALDLRVAAGNHAGALAYVERAIVDTRRREEELRARLAAVPRRAASNPQYNRISDRLHTFGAEGLEERHRAIWIDAFLAGTATGDPPAGVVRVDPNEPALPIEPSRPDRHPHTVDSHDWVLLAPPGRAIAGVRVEAPARGAGDTQPGLARISATAWDDSERTGMLDTEVPGGATTPLRLVARLSSPARCVRAWMSLQRGSMDAGSLRVDLVPAPSVDAEPGSRPQHEVVVARGVRGWAQHLRLSRDFEGRVHAVFCDGSLVSVFGQTGRASVHHDPDLWIATSVDDGRSFGRARRVAVSSDALDAFPTLLHDRNGRHRLAWVSNRNDPTRVRAWHAESSDLVSWSFPRRVPLAHDESWDAARLGSTGLAGAAVAYPKLLQDDRGTLHLFATSWNGIDGPGIYEITTTDGAVWAAPRRVMEGEAIGSVTRVGPESFLCAARLVHSPVTSVVRSDAGGPWRVVASPQTARVASDYWIARPAVGSDATGVAYLWDFVTPRHLRLFRSVDGGWRALDVVLEQAPATDVLVLSDGTVLTALWEFVRRGEARVHRWEPAK